MKIFISWSGRKSQEVAKALKEWIPCVIQSAKPYFSSADIDKGARWSADIAKELQDASFGILCVTQENLSSSWLNFEAGALSKSIEQSKVCPFLIDLKPSDIQDSPILQFQMTSATEDDVLKLVKSINTNLGDKKLEESVLLSSFEAFWPKIDKLLQSISQKNDLETNDSLEEKKTYPLEEILELVRYQHRLLKNPVELLPPEYLREILKQNDRYLHRKPVPRGLNIEIMEHARYLNKILSECVHDCIVLENESTDNSSYIRNIKQAQELSERLIRMISNLSYNERF